MLSCRNADIKDVNQYFIWANDPLVRFHSYKSENISYEQHESWFSKKLNDNNCLMLVFFDERLIDVGQVRIEVSDDTSAIIGISIDERFRGKSYGPEMLSVACDIFHKSHPDFSIDAFIKVDNIKSKVIFEKAGFEFKGDVIYNKFNSFHFIKYANR